jgi:hypothetical protein
VRVPASECRSGRSGTAGLASVPRPKELRATSPGFYVALGDAQPVGGDVGVQLRIYFHLTATGAAPLVASATRLLNRAALPFSLKVPNHPAAFNRCDAAVLYLDDFAAAREALCGIISSCAAFLRREPPAFAKPLSPGAAVGEHVPRQGASFGTSRCRFLAEAIVAARDHRASRLADRVDVVARCFADHGLDLDAPYLAPGSSDAYEL